jgi:hypothetical protein
VLKTLVTQRSQIRRSVVFQGTINVLKKGTITSSKFNRTFLTPMMRPF